MQIKKHIFESIKEMTFFCLKFLYNAYTQNIAD